MPMAAGPTPAVGVVPVPVAAGPTPAVAAAPAATTIGVRPGRIGEAAPAGGAPVLGATTAVVGPGAIPTAVGALPAPQAQVIGVRPGHVGEGGMAGAAGRAEEGLHEIQVRRPACFAGPLGFACQTAAWAVRRQQVQRSYAAVWPAQHDSMPSPPECTCRHAIYDLPPLSLSTCPHPPPHCCVLLQGDRVKVQRMREAAAAAPGGMPQASPLSVLCLWRCTWGGRG